MMHVFELSGEPYYAYPGKELKMILNGQNLKLFIDENKHLVYDGEDYVVSQVSFYENGRKITLSNRLTFAGEWHFIYENKQIKIPGKTFPTDGRIKLILKDEYWHKRPDYWSNGVMHTFGSAKVPSYE